MRGPWGTLAVTLVLQALVSMAVITVPAMAPAMAQALAVSPALVGPYVGIVYGAAMFASLAGGSMVARFGAIRVSQACVVLCAAGLAISATPSLAATVLGAVFIGFGYGPMTPASSHLLAKTTPAHRMSLVFSVKQTGVPLGGVLAGAFVPLLLGWGWQAALLGVALANLLCALLAQPMRAALDEDRSASAPLVFGNLARPLRMVFAHRELRMLAFCSFLFSMAQLSLTAYIVTFLHTSLAYTLVAAGLVLSVSQFAGVGGRVVWGYISDRWLGARRMLLVLGATMSLACVATALLQPGASPWLVFAIMTVYGMTAIGWNGVYLAEVARQAPPGEAGMATGGSLAITYFGVVLGPPAFGVVASLTGSYRAGYAVAAAATALSVVALTLRRAR
ncbi:MFS transporter [Ramlibacter sp.]|uniref:MFS transporter n=1 Tax=Ramlibacter sp. TaxID=1917967 RepID=UPI003D0B7072